MAIARLLYLLVFLGITLRCAAPALAEPLPLLASPAPPSSLALSSSPSRGSDGRVFWSLAAGLATALVPMAVGGGLSAGSSVREIKQAGLDFIGAGLVLGPLVAHAVAGEEERGALFALPTLASAIGMRCLIAAHPDVVEESTLEARVAFLAVFSLTLVSSTIGFIDSTMAGERRRRRLRLTPLFSPTSGQVGVSIGGNL